MTDRDFAIDPMETQLTFRAAFKELRKIEGGGAHPILYIRTIEIRLIDQWGDDGMCQDVQIDLIGFESLRSGDIDRRQKRAHSVISFAWSEIPLAVEVLKAYEVHGATMALNVLREKVQSSENERLSRYASLFN